METVNHVVNNCYSSRRDVIRRHNEVRDAFVDDAIPKNLMVEKEKQFGKLELDYVVQNTQKRETWIIDVKMSTESTESFSANEHAISEMYDSLRRALSIHGYQTIVNTLQFGVLGGLSRASTTFLSKLFRSRGKQDATKQKIVALKLHSPRNLMDDSKPQWTKKN